MGAGRTAGRGREELPALALSGGQAIAALPNENPHSATIRVNAVKILATWMREIACVSIFSAASSALFWTDQRR